MGFILNGNNEINCKIHVTENLVATFQKVNKVMGKTINNLNKIESLLAKNSFSKLENAFNSVNSTVNRTSNSIVNNFSSIDASVSKTKKKISEMKSVLNDSSAPFFIMTNIFEKFATKIAKSLSFINIKDVIKRVIEFISTSLESSRIQANAELQLNVVLSNRGISKSFDEIKKKAEQLQSIGFFKDEVILAGASKLSSYLKDVKAITRMMDIMANYATGVSGGKPVNPKQMVQYATLLGRAMQGSFMGMLRYGFKFNTAQQAILKGVATESQYIQVLGKNYKDLSEDMRKVEVIGQLINNSWGNLYQTMGNTPFGKFEQLKNSLGDIREEVGNKLLPSINKLFDTVQQNIPTIKESISSITDALSPFISTINVILENVFSGFSKSSKSIRNVAADLMPSIGILSAAALAIAALIKTVTFLLSPLGIIIAVITGISAAIGITVNQINKVQNKSISAVGIITGTLYTFWTFVKNIFASIWDVVATLIEFLVNCWENPVAAGKAAFAKLLAGIADILAKIVEVVGKAASKIADLFVDSINPIINGWNKFVDSSHIGIKLNTLKKGDSRNVINDTVSNIRWAANRYREVAADEEKKIKNNFVLDRISQKPLEDAYKEGYAWGKSMTNEIEQKIQGMFDNADLIDDIANNAGRIADGTEQINGKLDATEADLKYMRDLAEREAINRFTTAEIKVDMTNNNAINSKMDIDGVINILTEKLNEQLNTQVIGVYNY